MSRICINCDSRFSCNAYRAYAEGERAPVAAEFAFYDDYGSDVEQAEWLSTNLDAGLPQDIDDLI